MPITPIKTLDLDTTGTNRDNKILDEPHTLSARPTKSIAPNYGAFFAGSLVISDNGQILVRGIDYQIVELHQEATLRYGKEISSVILIIKQQVSPTVTITYQALGGHYATADTAIANMYQSVISDNRPVDWTNVFDKPTEFNPTIHRHLLDDVYGFEPVVDYLERIKRAITLGQTNIVLEIVNSLLAKFKRKDLPKVLPSAKLIQYDALLYFLSRRKILNDIWVDLIDESWIKGNSYTVQIDTSAYPINTVLHWEFYTPDMHVGLFSIKGSYFTTNGGIKDIQIYVPCENNVTVSPLYLGIKTNLSDDEYSAVTYTIDIQENVGTNNNYAMLLYGLMDRHRDSSLVANYAFDDELRLWYTLTNY